MHKFLSLFWFSIFTQLLQSVDIQLGMAMESPRATLAVKRRLSCEMAKCWHQVVRHSNPFTCENLYFFLYLFFVQYFLYYIFPSFVKENLYFICL